MLLLLGIGVVMRHAWRESAQEAQTAEKLARLHDIGPLLQKSFKDFAGF